MSIFGQVWIFSATAFVLGAFLSWLFLAWPSQRKVQDLEHRLAGTPTPYSSVPDGLGGASRSNGDADPVTIGPDSPTFMLLGSDQVAELHTAAEDASPGMNHYLAPESSPGRGEVTFPDVGGGPVRADHPGDPFGGTEIDAELDVVFHEVGELDSVAAEWGPGNELDVEHHRDVETGHIDDEPVIRSERLDTEDGARADSVPADDNPADGNPADGNPADGDLADGTPVDGVLGGVSVPDAVPDAVPEVEPGVEADVARGVEADAESDMAPERKASLFEPVLPEEGTEDAFASSEPLIEQRTETVGDELGAGDEEREKPEEQTSVLPKRQPHQALSGFDSPGPVQPAVRSTTSQESRSVSLEAQSGSLFEPMGTPSGSAPPARQSALDSGAEGEAPAAGPFGPGSALPLADGDSPSEEFMIKGSVTALRYCTQDSPRYPQLIAEVWFRSPSDAERVGFHPLD